MKMLGSPIIADDNHAEDRARATESPEKGVDVNPLTTTGSPIVVIMIRSDTAKLTTNMLPGVLREPV